MNIKLLLLDLDDTLLNSNGELSQRTQTAVNRAVEYGITVAIASGRMHKSLLPYVERLNTHGPVVSYNGALIKDSLTDRTIYSNPVPLELAREILRYTKKNSIYSQFYTEQDYFFEEHCKLSEAYYRSADIKGIALGSGLADKIEFPPPKILLIDHDLEKVMLHTEKLRMLFGDKLYITRSKQQYIEIMNKGVNKGGALKKMCEIFSIDIADSMAIGDGLNDLEMIKSAGLGVAVATASEEVREAADIVCKSSDEDGPAEIIERYILNQK